MKANNFKKERKVYIERQEGIKEFAQENILGKFSPIQQLTKSKFPIQSRYISLPVVWLILQSLSSQSS